MARELKRTTCSRDCPDACGILASVEDGRVVHLRGDPDHPVTQGFLCYRTASFLDLQYGPTRLTQPLVREGGRLVPASMEAALDLVARQLLRIREESGPAAILHYRSGGSLGLLKHVADRFFEEFGPCTATVGDICSGAGEAAQVEDFGVSDSNDLFDLLNSRTIYLWGKNPFVSNVHLVPVLKEARQRGTRVVLIDPVHHKGTTLADRYLQPCPGGDLDIALGVGRILLDTGRADPQALAACEPIDGYRRLVQGRTVSDYAAGSGLTVADLEAIAEDFASGPTAILVGWGMQRRGHGSAIVRSLDALSAISGNLFRVGGGCSFYFRRRGAFAVDRLVQGTRIAPRTVREPLLGEDIVAAKDPPIRALWITAGNPVCMLPDSAGVARALEATEFVVVADPFLTDTARRAHVVFPVPTLLEDDDLLGAYGHHWLGESRGVVPPPSGVMHEVQLFQELARRTGIGAAMAGSVDEYKRRLLTKVEPLGVSLETLRTGPVRNPLAGQLRFPERRVETRNGKVQLLTAVPSRAVPDPSYPLWLFSNSNLESQSAQWSGRGLGTHTWITVHPDSAAGRKAGEVVEVESPQGRLRAELRLDPRQRRDVAIMPKGGHYDRGHSANALIAARATDRGMGAAYLDCRVRLV